MSVHPHHVGRLGGDGPVVRLWPVRVAGVRGGAWRPDSRINAAPVHCEVRIPSTQLRPGLSVPLAMKRRGFEHPAVGHQDVVRGSADRPAATYTAQGTANRLPPRIHSGCGATRGRPESRHTPDGWRSLGPLRVDLRRAKGPPASSWSTFAYSNSVISSSSIPAADDGLRPEHPVRGSSASPAPTKREPASATPAPRDPSSARDTDSRSSRRI